MAQIVPLLMPLRLELNQYLYHIDDQPYELFFITKGQIQFIVDQDEIILKTWLQNAYFGDIEVYEEIKRICNAKAVMGTDLYLLNKKHLDEIILKEFPDIDRLLRDTAQARFKKLKIAYTNAFHSIE